MPLQYAALTRLVNLTTTLLLHPCAGDDRAREALQARDQVAAELAKPVEADRFVKSEALLLADALVHMQRDINCGVSAARFAAVVGMLLPFIKEDQFDALRASLASRAATTEQARR